MAINNGTLFIPYQFTQMSLTLTNSQGASGLYDIFLAYNSNSPVIGTGPVWSTSTAGSCVRGTGAGTTQISRDATTGLWVNTVSMSLIYNTGSGNNTITVGAGQGLYLGSIFVDGAAGQVSCYRSYGQSRKWGIFNAYNRVPLYLKAGDSTASWTYTTATWRSANGSTANSLVVFSGLAEDIFELSYESAFQNNGAGSLASIGIGYNSTTATTGKIGMMGNYSNSGVSPSIPPARYITPPALGINIITALEYSLATGTSTWYGTETNMLLSAIWKA